MKRCPRCQEEKSRTEFHKNKSRKDGLASYCKPCAIEYSTQWFKTPKGKAAIHKVNTSEKGKARMRRYDVSEKGKDKAKRQRQTKKYRKRHVEANMRYRKRHPEICKAHAVVQNEIDTRRMQKASFWLCRICYDNSADHYHHPSYEPENWLKVVPVCHSCHRNIHSTNDSD